MIKTENLTRRDVGRTVVFDEFQIGKITDWKHGRVYVDYGFGTFPTPPCQLRFANLSERLCGQHGRCFAIAVIAIFLASAGAVAAMPSLKIAAGFLIASAFFKFWSTEAT